MTGPAGALVMVAHGTREPAGPVVLDELAEGVRRRLPEVAVRLAYVDVIGPTLEDELARAGGPVVLVPLFLASGYHVRIDIPDVLERSGTQARVTPALGPDEAVIAAVAERLGAAGPLADAVVLAAAGSSDKRALADVELAARRLSGMLARPVSVGFAATASPTVAEAVATLRDAGNHRIGVAS